MRGTYDFFFLGGGTVAQTQEMKGGSFTPHFFFGGGLW